ncbi:hypothetical protein [Caulobacter hibisci]|uniref:SseB protein N-terminal domain-containing protein n=1 Tax=Caulobacter hibisci TaxID=2035993 RepID=A0ABS0SWV4_9CAUL|nr:hypothetical protein [Caulobacter hibisci]MBI1684063.1 hypothetical protein [Caulobacter hibisci]
MTVEELVDLLQGFDPRAVVLIPMRSGRGERCVPVVEAAPVAGSHFANGAVRLCSFPTVLMAADQDLADWRPGLAD